MEKTEFFKFHLTNEEIMIFEGDSKCEKMKIPFKEVDFAYVEDIKLELTERISKFFGVNSVDLVPFDKEDEERIRMFAMSNFVKYAG